MTGVNQHWTCTTCQAESLLSPCGECTNLNLRGIKENSCKCYSCKITNYYLDCKQCLTWYSVNESKDNLDGKLLSCVLSCEQVQMLKCTNCQSLKRIDNFNNEMKNYCNSCNKYYFKQICQFCREVSTFNQKESQLKQKCQNKKCSKGTYLKTGKIQNQQVIIGQFIKSNEIQQVQPQKQQSTSKYLDNLDLMNFEQDNDNTQFNQNKNNVNLLDIDQHLDQQPQNESSITKCQKCFNTTDVIITTPCGHKVTCYQCLENQLNCISCGEQISNRIMNTFNRDFYQEIKERILIYKQE
ncbi:unnamed protein product [Paramecium primaurelia]|uniref:RING-type domain-containing protein n=1 Tax=Paramecium primaurelia TaxID=5886 RepID=A0A8S1LPL7_PARPR|nr:unnamed protein product [Paramecium primaurelia]